MKLTPRHRAETLEALICERLIHRTDQTAHISLQILNCQKIRAEAQRPESPKRQNQPRGAKTSTQPDQTCPRFYPQTQKPAPPVTRPRTQQRVPAPSVKGCLGPCAKLRKQKIGGPVTFPSQKAQPSETARLPFTPHPLCGTRTASDGATSRRCRRLAADARPPLAHVDCRVIAPPWTSGP